MSTTNPTPKKYAFANILNYLGEDYTYKDTTGKKHTIAKNDTWKADVVTTYTDDAEAWKGDSDSADTVYIGYKHREPTVLKKTSGLPAARDGYVYLVSAPVCAVARILEDRTDCITKADLIRAARYNDGYVYFTT